MTAEDVLEEYAAFYHDAMAEQARPVPRSKAFAESILTIPTNLKNGTWPVLFKDNTTPLLHEPSMPLTTLQKRWMKALLLDARIALFAPSAEGLEEVQPLFQPERCPYLPRERNAQQII